MKKLRIVITTGISIILILMSAACVNSPTTTPPSTTPATTTPTSVTPSPTSAMSQYQVEYTLFSRFPDFFWCDPDIYPISREGQEQANALEQFPSIRSNETEFLAILEHLSLPVKSEYTDAEKLSIYREHKKLTRAVTVAPETGSSYTFSIRTGQNQGLLIKGTIDTSGGIKIQSQETSFNTCPICLVKGTLIDTLSGPVPVEQVQPGMLVWTISLSGQRIAAPVIKTSSTPVPEFFQVLTITLDDGRTVTASPGHPSIDYLPLRDFGIGDTLDNGRIVSIDSTTYSGGATYDLRPAGDTGGYWANGILLGSTLPGS